MRTLWNNIINGGLCEWDVAFEAAQEFIAKNDCLSVDLEEYREPEASDICVKEMADEVWECLYDLLRNQEHMSNDDGWPRLPALKGSKRPDAWKHLRDAIEYVLGDHLDLSEAAWQPTGKRRDVIRDGDGYRWEELQNA